MQYNKKGCDMNGNPIIVIQRPRKWQQRGYVISALLTLIIFITLINLSSAQELQTLGTFKSGTNIDLIQICSNDTSLCTSCNISSVYYPNSSLFLSDKIMTKRSADFNYTLTTSTDITPLGIYNVNGVCSAGSQVQVWSYTFEITQSGTQGSVTQAIIYAIAAFIILILFIMSLYGAIVIPWKNPRNEEGFFIGMNEMKYVKLFLWFASYLLILMLTYLINNVTLGYLQFTIASNIFHAIYWFFMSMLWPTIVVFIIVGATKAVYDMKLLEDLQRGLNIQ